MTSADSLIQGSGVHRGVIKSGLCQFKLSGPYQDTHTIDIAPHGLPTALARRTSIFGTSATKRVDSAPAHISSHFCARASPSKRFPAPQASVSTAQRKKILSSAQEVHFACENAGWRRTLRTRLEGTLKVARLEDDVGTSLDHLLRVRLW